MIREKITQAIKILQEEKIDCWLTFVRESSTTPDPAMDMIVGTGVTWHSAFIITAKGDTIALVGSLDKANQQDHNYYDKIIGYVESIEKPLLDILHDLNPDKIAINYSLNSPAADGMTYGMYLQLQKYLKGSPFSDRLVSAENILNKLRGRKSKTEIQHVTEAIRLTIKMLDAVSQFIIAGRTEKEIAGFLVDRVKQEGVRLATGAGYEQFLAGEAPIPGPAGCGGPGSVESGGSTTTLPTRVAIAGGPALGQFREDGTLAANCSVFNFNPFNYYQTPQKRYGGFAMGHFEINEHAEAYARLSYSSTKVRQQVAPSGFFGNSWWTPLSNPLMSDQARNFIIDAANAGVAAGTVVQAAPDVFDNWRDLNGNGVVDAADDLRIQYRRRTVEFGTRSTAYDTNAIQFLTGVRGDIMGDWRYDVSYQYGQSQRTNIAAGYTNVANGEVAVTGITDPNTGEIVCRDGGSDCVPINLFGGFGAITPEMAAFSSAAAFEKSLYEQEIVTGSVNGPINALQLPTADSPLAVSFGAEYRTEQGDYRPDECWKLAPSSCLGGAGGNRLPLAGGFDVWEVFGEAIFPLVNGVTAVESLDLELGYRYSDYDPSGTSDTWKVGLNWRPHETVLIRAMQQKAARAPNVGELASPQTTGLDNATLDPCSIANAGNIDATLEALCISTGMSAAQVGAVEDIVSGQVNAFAGTDLESLPEIEEADTTTIGVVWTPNFANLVVSLDYYDIKVDGYIDTFRPQEVLDGCYVLGNPDECDKVRRIGGTLTIPGSGVETFTTNLEYIKIEGLEFSFTYGLDIGSWGGLTFAGTVNKTLTNERLSAKTSPVLDCNGYFGTSCEGPAPELGWVQRTTWDYGNFSASYLWRHIGSVSVEPGERDNTFEKFRNIGSYDYFDVYGSWQATDQLRVNIGVTNLFDKDPPVVGNEAADTSSNSGNTFPSQYSVLGRSYSVGFTARF